MTETGGPPTDRIPSRIVVARAPLRVSLGGGGTDLPSYAHRHGGLVISCAIDRYVAAAVYPRAFDGGVHSLLEKWESVPSVEALGHPFARAVLARARPEGDVQITSFGDAPSGAGLGGSGAFTVALIHALRHGGSPGALALAEEASAVETDDLERPVGKHDHYMAAFGGLRALRIGPDLSVHPELLAVPEAVHRHLRENLLLFYTGLSRDAGEILAAQDRMTKQGESQTVGALESIHRLAGDMLEALTSGKTGDIGPMLDEHWSQKTRLSNAVSNSRVDALYRVALDAGSDGGKLLGAGGGGFLLLNCPDDRVQEVRSAMDAEGLRELPFGLDESGSRATALDLGWF